jgi:hypothetical protein
MASHLNLITYQTAADLPLDVPGPMISVGTKNLLY